MIAQLKRGGVNEGLEGRSGLALGLCRPVEGAHDLGLAPAHHAPHRTIRRHHHDRRLRLGAVTHLFLENILERILGSALDPLIKRGLDDHILSRVAGEKLWPRGHDPIGEIAAGLRLCRLR